MTEDFQQKIRDAQRRRHPITIEDLHFAWREDCKELSSSDPVVTADIVPNMQAKYSELMMDHIVKARALQAEYDKLYKVKYTYYRGDLNNDPEELKKRKWEPNQKKVDVSQVKTYLTGDDDLVALKMSLDLEMDIANYVKECIAFISNRSYAVTNKVKWQIYMMGGKTD
jgi:hypothetical protein